MLTKWKAKFAVFAILALAATVLVALPVGAVANEGGTSDAQVSTGAEIQTGNRAPIIVCKWELPDSVRDTVPNPVVGTIGLGPDSVPPTPGMEYGNDDDWEDIASTPCRSGDAGDTVYVTDGSERNVIQVEANPDNDPSERYIELWAAVRGSASSSSLTSMFWDIRHPDGSFKTQEYGVRAGQPEQYGATYNQGSWSLATNGMWYAASALTGQIAADTLRNQSGLIARAAQSEIDLIKAGFWLDKHQPCGEYSVRAYASNVYGTTSLENTLTVLCFVELVTDFTSVDWGRIDPGALDMVYGDTIMSDGQIGLGPTVMNLGSGEMSLEIEFTAMPWVKDGDGKVITNPGTKKITVFDAAFGINPSYLSYLDLEVTDQGNATGYFGRGYYNVLCANETGKLDLSIHPGIDLPTGTYAGTMWLYGQPWGDETSPCLNERGDWQTPQTDPITVRYPPPGSPD